MNTIEMVPASGIVTHKSTPKYFTDLGLISY